MNCSFLIKKKEKKKEEEKNAYVDERSFSSAYNL